MGNFIPRSLSVFEGVHDLDFLVEHFLATAAVAGSRWHEGKSKSGETVHHFVPAAIFTHLTAL